MWNFTHDMWHITDDRWHMLDDTWFICIVLVLLSLHTLRDSVSAVCDFFLIVMLWFFGQFTWLQSRLAAWLWVDSSLEHNFISFLSMLIAARRERQAQSRVLPLLTDPPSRVTRVWPDRLKLDRVTDTIGSNASHREGVPIVGVLYVNWVAYEVLVHGGLQLFGL